MDKLSNNGKTARLCVCIRGDQREYMDDLKRELTGYPNARIDGAIVRDALDALKLLILAAGANKGSTYHFGVCGKTVEVKVV